MISLCMIIKNEEKHLRKCLSSIKGIADEIILVDTGSTDNSLTIAEEFNCKIFHFTWTANFSEARNFSLDKASSNWILYLDADESLNENSRHELMNISKSKADKAYYCKLLNVDTINNRPSIMLYPRLFPNNKLVRFTGAVHEQIESSLTNVNIPIHSSGIEIIHDGYNIKDDDLQLKAKRNLDILNKEYTSLPNSYNAFQLAQTYGILKESTSAEKYFLLSIKDNSLRKEYRSVAYRYLAINNAERNDFNKALDFIVKSLKEDPQQLLTHMAASNIYKAVNKEVEAFNCCKEALKISKKILNNQLSSFQNIFLPSQNILLQGLQIAVHFNNKEMFNYFYNLIPEQNKSDFEVVIVYGKYLNQNNSLQEAEKCFRTAYELQPWNPAPLFYIISLLIKSARLTDAISLIETSVNIHNNPEILTKLLHIKKVINNNC